MISKDKDSVYSNILTSDTFSEIDDDDDDDLNPNKDLNRITFDNVTETAGTNNNQTNRSSLHRNSFPSSVYDSIDRSFDLPLRNDNHILKQNRNFEGLLDDPLWNDVNDNIAGSLEKKLSNTSIHNKKVRFNDFRNDIGHANNIDDKIDISRDTSNVELLLQNANECNDLVNENLIKLKSNLLMPTNLDYHEARRNSDTVTNSKNNNINDGGGLYRSMSEIGTARTESLSNFDLSENELNSQITDNNTSGSNFSIDNIDVDIDNILRNEKLNNSNSTIGKVRSNDSALSDTANRNDEIDGIPDQMDRIEDNNIPYFTEDICKEKIKQYLIRKEQEQNCKCKSDNNDPNYAIHLVPLLYDPSLIDTENYKISPDDTIQNFIKTLNLMLKLSKLVNANKDSTKEDEVSNRNNEIGKPIIVDKYKPFTMKNMPSITFEELIYRIQNKCMFGSIIYETATYLLQILLLTGSLAKLSTDNDNNENSTENGDTNENTDKIPIAFEMRHQLPENQIHRIIIATIRISGKLTEDSLHSHNYFCKVVGITKKLLSRLESALLNCLKNDSLIITSEKLSASIVILKKLEEMVNTMNVSSSEEPKQ